MLSFQQAKELFESRPKVKLANNTYFVKTDDGYGVKLYQTVIVEILPGDRYRLRTRGYRTTTTKQRINSFSPVTIFQRDFNWYINTGDDILFVEGMTVNIFGENLWPDRDDYPNAKV